jgi:hypothetical protein
VQDRPYYQQDQRKKTADHNDLSHQQLLPAGAPLDASRTDSPLDDDSEGCDLLTDVVPETVMACRC